MPKQCQTSADTARTRTQRIALNDRVVNTLAIPPSGNRIYYDDRVRGFGCRVTSAGARSFIFNYRTAGRERRITIGQYPAWKAVAARKQAEALRRDVDVGGDPLHEREGRRAAPTMKDLYTRYSSEHLPTKASRSAADDRSMWVNDILPVLGSSKVQDVTFTDCAGLHAKISTNRSVRANRILEVLRKALNLSVRWGWIERNPAAGVHKNREHKRHRFLSRESVLMLKRALRASRATVRRCNPLHASHRMPKE